MPCFYYISPKKFSSTSLIIFVSFENFEKSRVSPLLSIFDDFMKCRIPVSEFFDSIIDAMRKTRPLKRWVRFRESIGNSMNISVIYRAHWREKPMKLHRITVALSSLGSIFFFVSSLDIAFWDVKRSCYQVKSVSVLESKRIPI